MGGIARIRRFELFAWRVLHFWSYVFQTAKMAGGGCSWGFWDALGTLPSGMLQPPWHVTAALAFYRTLFSYPSIFPSTHLSPKSYVLGAKSKVLSRMS